MKQIKTVLRPYSELYTFDKEVNSLLSEGWNLRKREIQKVSGEISESFNIPAVYVLYAELDRETKPFPEEITL